MISVKLQKPKTYAFMYIRNNKKGCQQLFNNNNDNNNVLIIHDCYALTKQNNRYKILYFYTTKAYLQKHLNQQTI